MRFRVRTSLLAFPALLALGAPAHAQTLKDLYPEIATLIASDGAIDDELGQAVSLSGDTLAVGVPRDDIGVSSDQGSVRIFVRNNGVWSLQATLVAPDGSASMLFGRSVSLSGDTLAVGAPNEDIGLNADQGSVRIFVRNGGVWTQQAKLTVFDGLANDLFGWSVSLAGNTVAVGAPYDDVGVNADQGSVRVFTRSGGTWTLQQSVTASDGAFGDSFGYAVSLSGETLAIGVPVDTVGPNPQQGSVRVFVRNGSLWASQATLTASDGAVSDFLGLAVSLSGDTLAVGAPSDDVGANIEQGSVRVFTRTGTSWTAQATLTASGGEAGDTFGWPLSLSGDTLAVGAGLDDIGASINQGSVRLFVRSGSTWTALTTLTTSDGAAGDQFGSASLAVAGDSLAVGMPLYDLGASVNQGSVRVFGIHRVWNATRGFGSNSLASAVASALAGDRLLVGNLAFSQADGIIDASQKRLTFTALEPLTLSASALMTVANDTVFEKSPAVSVGGLTVNGRLVAPVDGTVTFERVAVGLPGQLAQRGSDILVNHSLMTLAGGVSYLEGTVLAPTVATDPGAQHRVAADTNIFASYANAGATIIQRGVLYIYGTLVNTGTITGELNNGFLPPNPGDGFSIGDDYIVSAESSIILPDPVWWLRVGGNLDVKIDSASRFVMDQATLELTGIGLQGEQSVEVLSRDLGEDEAGFAASNFPIGAVRLRAGAMVSLADNHNNAPGKGGEAVYTQELVVPAGATLVTNGHKIYTRVATVAGEVSNPNDIVVVPGTPPCVADIFPNGFVDAADLSALLVSWGPCSGSCVADLDRDGEVDASDLAQLLVSWGPCAD